MGKNKIESMQANHHSFTEKMNILFAHTYLPSQVYELDSSDENYLGKFKGKLIEDTNDEAFEARTLLKGFIGYPFFDEDESTPKKVGKLILFAIKFVPIILLNTSKLITEVATGSLVAALEVAKNYLKQITHSDHAQNVTADLTEKNSFRSNPTRTQKILAYIGLGLINFAALPLCHLIHFSGKAITSPMKNAREAWQVTSHWRSKTRKNDLGEVVENGLIRRTAGYVFGGAAYLFSMSLSITAYSLLAPLTAPFLTYLGGTNAFAAVSNFIAPAAKFLAPIVTPVSNFLSQTIGNTIATGVKLIASVTSASFAHVLLSHSSSRLLMGIGSLFGVSGPTIGNGLRKVSNHLPIGNTTRKILNSLFNSNPVKQSQAKPSNSKSKNKNSAFFASKKTANNSLFSNASEKKPKETIPPPKEGLEYTGL